MKTDFSQVLWFYLVPRKKWLKLSTECQEIIFSHICLSSYQFDKIQILTYCTFKLFTCCSFIICYKGYKNDPKWRETAYFLFKKRNIFLWSDLNLTARRGLTPGKMQLRYILGELSL